MLSRAVVLSPSANFSKGLTSAMLGAPVYAQALKQHEAYCAALEECGLQLLRLEADERYPDSTFIEDAAVITKRGAIVTRPGAPSRIGEVVRVRKELAQFSTLSSIHHPGTLDGGDVCEVENHFFIGISARTNESGAKQLAEALASWGYPSSFVDIRDVKGILHLKSGLGYLGDNRLVVIDSLSNCEEFRTYDLSVVNWQEEYAANCVRVNERVLVAAGYPRLEKRLGELGYQTIALEMTEFQKMGGGLSCLSLRY
ncbi:MAG: N(G),N(G)-dimethylarginine dimethylaminohydrolase [Pyrinomonadaceae bacterium]|nr:N(G),N(G)-dimethylarginine dimethylaminohydrolase [Pyrinomonadaceae bacterium]